ncbi:jerky protein homolog-like [Rhizophagus clarus]|uniref:Jerky protein homolog-like n=1 Tax=Rhizophagus clarus TaxID=94130 RepID=A0A8H3QV17_9GLOM|nr:jerky protein homolog-like [Rhizophagus clarus]
MSTRKRTILSAAQKREICKTKEREPNLSNTSIAQRYNIGKSTVTDILNEKELAFFAKNFSIEDFHQSKGWLSGFKRRHRLRQFKKQGEASSAPSAELIENDHFAL